MYDHSSTNAPDSIKKLTNTYENSN